MGRAPLYSEAFLLQAQHRRASGRRKPVAFVPFCFIVQFFFFFGGGGGVGVGFRVFFWVFEVFSGFRIFAVLGFFGFLGFRASGFWIKFGGFGGFGVLESWGFRLVGFQGSRVSGFQVLYGFGVSRMRGP